MARLKDFFMGLFDKFFEYQNRKREERDSECRAAVNEVTDAVRGINQLLSNQDKYIYEYSYNRLKVEWLRVKKRYGKISRRLQKSPCCQELQRGIQELNHVLSALPQDIEQHNRKYLEEQTADAFKRIGSIEGRPLDRQQMECIVKDAPNHLIVAGAGTGKTTTILGKIKYLLSTEACGPDEILVLSFTSASANEMRNRLTKETGQTIQAGTFHKLGLQIIRESEGKAPVIYNDDPCKFIRGRIEVCLKDPGYAALFMSYLLFHRINQKSEFEFDSESSYREYLETNPPITIKGETVKSYGEMEIANFLTQYGIKYKYEEPYPTDTRTEQYDQYYPDFFLTDYGIYIEYYGINVQGEVPSYFAGRDGKSASDTYRESIAWKNKLHKENDTVLIECYAYEKFDGVMLDRLYTSLQKHGVVLEEVPAEQIFADMKAERKNRLDGLAGLLQTVLVLTKNRRLSCPALMELCSSPFHRGQQVIVKLFDPIYEAYEKMLSDRGAIDFNDMINLAADHIIAGEYHHPYKYVIIDEYQDISGAQYRLLQAMRTDRYYSLFCVGDDWQSIYRFAGSDIGYILNFSKYWGDAEISRIETTYRFSQRLIDISGRFVMKNPNQMKKAIHAHEDAEQYVLELIQGFTDKWAIQFMVNELENLPAGSSVYFIGRYQFDSDYLKDEPRLRTAYDNTEKVLKIMLLSRPDLKMTFYTAHKSKGLQADYVFIINNKSRNMGFPSKIENPPLVDMLLEQADMYPDAEERRLFYVAITRARKKVYLVTADNNISPFAEELKSIYQSELQKAALLCPLCGAPLKIRSGQFGAFYGCTGYRKTGCRYTRKTTHSKDR